MLLGIFFAVVLSFLGWTLYYSSHKRRELNRRIELELNRARAWEQD